MHTSRLHRFFVLVRLFGPCWLLGRVATAYIDPGTGSTLLQGLLATLFAAAFVIRIYWRRIKRLLHGDAVVADDEPRDRDERDD